MICVFGLGSGHTRFSVEKLPTSAAAIFAVYVGRLQPIVTDRKRLWIQPVDVTALSDPLALV